MNIGFSKYAGTPYIVKPTSDNINKLSFIRFFNATPLPISPLLFINQLTKAVLTTDIIVRADKTQRLKKP